MNIKIKKGDKVVVIAGKDKGKEGKILFVDKKGSRVIVEGVNMITRHVKPNKQRKYQAGGIIKQEASVHVSNVMYLHNGKPTRLGYKIIEGAEGQKAIKQRIAKSTGDVVDK